MVVRFDPHSPDFDAAYLEIGDRAAGWLAAEALSPDEPASTHFWLIGRFIDARREASRRRFAAATAGAL